MAGRPSVKTPELLADICMRLAAGESVRGICADESMPAASQVFNWLATDAQFQEQYTRAKQAGCLVLAEDLIHIADSPQVGVKEVDKVDKDGAPYTEITRGDMIDHRRLQVDTRKWYLSKLVPKIYGDKSTVDLNVKGDIVTRLQAGRKRAGG